MGVSSDRAIDVRRPHLAFSSVFLTGYGVTHMASEEDFKNLYLQKLKPNRDSTTLRVLYHYCKSISSSVGLA